MEERLSRGVMLSVQISSFIELIKSLRLTVKYETHDGFIFAQTQEFRGTAYASDVEQCRKDLVHDMKDWAEAFASDFEHWKLGREEEIPYLLKILLSTEEELLSCLN